jgi:membrane protease subunit HflC
MAGLRNLFLLAAAALALVVGATAFVVVDETEHAIVTQFGKPVAVYSDAGLRRKAPAPVQRITRFDKRLLLTETRETELLTKDKKNIIVTTYVSWRIEDPLIYLTAVRTREFAEARLSALIQSELGSSLGEVDFKDLVSDAAERAGLAGLEHKVMAAGKPIASSEYGIAMQDFGITRLMFPNQNLQSVFARMRAERARIARGYRSEGRAEAQKIRAEADRERAEALATAEADATRTRASGEAEAARIYADAYRGHEEFFRFIRTLETYEKVLGEKTTLVLPSDSPFLELLTQKAPRAWHRGPLQNGQPPSKGTRD